MFIFANVVFPTAVLHRWSRLALLAALLPAVGQAAENCPAGEDWALVNGNILTMDAGNRTVQSLRVRDERIVSVNTPIERGEPCVRVIDLGGRTVIPGLIDGHTHFIRTAQAPGPFIEGLESATSIQELQDALRAAARKAEPGEWLVAIGGFTSNQFREKRLPTKAELTSALPDHPVYMQLGYSTRGITNDEGRKVLASVGISTSEQGDVATDGKGLTYIIKRNTEARMRQRFGDYMQYAVSLGLTTVVDHACCDWLGAHLALDERPDTHIAEALWRSHRLLLRLRIQYDHRDIRDQKDIRSTTARIANATQGLGDDMYKAVRFGEQVLAAGASDEEILAVFQRLADAGWAVSQHTIKREETEKYLRIMEQVAARTPLAPLRWSLEHVFEISPEQIARLKKIGVGARVQDHDYIRSSASSWNAGPPFRSLLESGIPMGAGTDSGVVGALNPWLALYYMVTGKDAGGTLLIPGEQISRMDALRLYTRANAWYNFEEDTLGSLEPGKLADLVVLDKPYLQVQDEDIKQIHSLLTMRGGKVVHAKGDFASLAGAGAGIIRKD